MAPSITAAVAVPYVCATAVARAVAVRNWKRVDWLQMKPARIASSG